MKKIYIALTGLLLLFTSCNIYRYEEHQSRVTQPGTAGIITSTTADLNVSGTRISHTENFTHDKYENDVNINDAKEYTLSAALVKYNADVLLGPLYDITTNDKNDQVSVTVTGYPANYVNFRKTTPDDSLLLLTTTTLPQASEFKTSTKANQIWAVQRGWQNSIFATYGRFVTPGLGYAGGFRFNKSILIGFGIEANYSCRDIHLSYHHDSYYGDYTRKSAFMSVPLYAQFNWYIIGNKRVNPFVGINIGADICTDFNDFWSGVHARGDFGISFRIKPKTGLFVSYNVGTLLAGKNSYRCYHGLKIGFMF